MATINDIIVWFHPDMHVKVLYWAMKEDVTTPVFIKKAIEAGLKAQCYGVSTQKLEQYTYGVAMGELKVISVPVGREIITALDEYLEGKQQCSRLSLVRFLVDEYGGFLMAGEDD